MLAHLEWPEIRSHSTGLRANARFGGKTLRNSRQGGSHARYCCDCQTERKAVRTLAHARCARLRRLSKSLQRYGRQVPGADRAVREPKRRGGLRSLRPRSGRAAVGARWRPQLRRQGGLRRRIDARLHSDEGHYGRPGASGCARQSAAILSNPLRPCHASPVMSVIRKKAIIEARPAAAPAGELKKNRITGGPPIPKPPLKRPEAVPVAKVAAGPGNDFRA